MHSSQLKPPVPEVWREEEFRKTVTTPQMVFGVTRLSQTMLELTASRNVNSPPLAIPRSIQALPGLPTELCLERSLGGGESWLR